MKDRPSRAQPMKEDVMESKTFAPTPKDAIAAVTFLRDEVRKGKLAMAPLLKKKLQEIGLFREGAYRRLIDEGKKVFAARTKAANDEFVHDIETLDAYEAHNSEFRAKVKGFLDDISKARGEEKAYARIDSLKAFDLIFVISGGGPGTSSETMNLFLYQQAFAFYNMGYAAAVTVVFFVIILLISLILFSARQQEKWQ